MIKEYIRLVQEALAEKGNAYAKAIVEGSCTDHASYLAACGRVDTYVEARAVLDDVYKDLFPNGEDE